VTRYLFCARWRAWGSVAITLTLLLFMGQVAHADPSGETSLEEVHFQVLDAFDRPYEQARGMLAVGVRLTSEGAPTIKGRKTFEAEGVEYRIDDDQYIQFPVVDSRADLRFVVFRDAGKNPVTYEMVLLKKKGSGWVSEALRPSRWSAGQGKTKAETRASSRAPWKTSEVLLILACTAVAAILVWATFGYWAFRRMLFVRRSEVAGAESKSKVLVLVGFLFAVAAAVVIFARPQVINGNPLLIHFRVWGVFLAILGIAALVTFMSTNKR